MSLAIHELLGRDIDPIDDVRREFERFFTDDYRHPMNGDWMSDDYWRIIDLTTQPKPLNTEDSRKLNSSIERLNNKPATVCRSLGYISLIDAYNSVAEQINTINSNDSSRSEILSMQFLESS